MIKDLTIEELYALIIGLEQEYKSVFDPDGSKGIKNITYGDKIRTLEIMILLLMERVERLEND